MQERKPPHWIKLVALLQIIFGVLGVLNAVSGTVMLAVGGPGAGLAPSPGTTPQAQAAQDFQDSIRRAMESAPGGKAWQFGETGFSALLSVVMLASGVGLLKMQPWGRALAIAYALASLLQKGAGLVYGFVFQLPFANQVMDELAARGPDYQALAAIGRVMFYVMPCLSAVVGIYPLLVLLFMLKASTRAAFRAGATEAPAAPAPPEKSDPTGQP
jgi:hypothetical protein